MKKFDTLSKQSNWKQIELGFYKTNSRIKSIEGFQLYVRETEIEDFLKKFSNRKPSKAPKTTVQQVVSKDGIGKHNSDLTPQSSGLQYDEEGLPLIADFSNYESLKNLRSDKPCLLIGFDTEFYYKEINGEQERSVLSWQFSLIRNRIMYEFIFLKDGPRDLSLRQALSTILDYLDFESLDVRKYTCYEYCYGWKNGKPLKRECSDKKEAITKGRYRWNGTKFINKKVYRSCDNESSFYHKFTKIPSDKRQTVCIVSHAGKADLTTFSDRKDYWLLWSEIQGGLVSLQSGYYNINSSQRVNNKYIYPVVISYSDTMCHAAGDNKRLETLGEVIGIPKLNLENSIKQNMNILLENDPMIFLSMHLVIL